MTEPAAHKADTRLAVSATLHCLVGCGIGEVLGMSAGMALGLSTLVTIVLAVAAGFVAGFGLGLLPLLRAGYAFRDAARQVLLVEGLSIAVMEAAQVATEVAIPGLMQAGFADPVFWLGMIAALIAGFAAAYPVNLHMVRKGLRHHHGMPRRD